MTENLYNLAKACLDCSDPISKCKFTQQLVDAVNDRRIDLTSLDTPLAIDQPGRPLKPVLVTPRELPRRKLGSETGRATLLHALAHIEFNAINLAWDAIYRFRGLPEAYYHDWAKVAGEEAYHFQLLCTRLEQLGYCYGDFSAHNGLWEMACTTADDPLVRMALVPRVLEARGLDVTPGIIARLQKAGDDASVAILKIILRDEIGHVEIGTRWYRYLCDQRGLDADTTFMNLMEEYMQGQVKGPLHRDARIAAGFSAQEIDNLQQLVDQKK